MPTKVMCSFPPELLAQIDFVASVELRTRSDLLREAMRRYINEFKRNVIASSFRIEPVALPAPSPKSLPRFQSDRVNQLIHEQNKVDPPLLIALPV